MRSPRYLKRARVSAWLADGTRSSPVISSGKIESRTSRSSICSSQPMLPYRESLEKFERTSVQLSQQNTKILSIGLSEPSRFHDQHSLPQPSIMADLIKLIRHPGFIIGICFVYSIWASVSEPPAVAEARRQRRLRQKQEKQQQKMQALTEKEGMGKAATQKEISSEQPWDR